MTNLYSQVKRGQSRKEGILRLEDYSSNFIDEIIRVKGGKKLILITFHRRENLANIDAVISAVFELSKSEEFIIVWPVHLNPLIQKRVHNQLDCVRNVYLTQPLSYQDFIWIMNESFVIMTDSGGVQEEAPSLGKPVLVLRDTTERPEGVENGNAKLIGCNFDKIVEEVRNLSGDSTYYNSFSQEKNIYGDGLSSARIVNLLIENFNDPCV